MKRWLAGIVVLVLALTCVPFAVKAEEAVPTSSAAVSDFTISISDPKGDDYGPGWYKYPTNAVFKKGDFDLTGFELKSAGDNYIATFDVANLDNPWGGNGFSKQTFFLFFSTAT
ncbi:glucodextranase DOMON-like domain-containing protein, partial [Coprothermobacter platensis]|uniref:glucodextranase DOMON-like domain-containing protein n=1 Tax=Coprothermobacter platensis TaxID=108819 RepID=UPI00058DC447